MLPGGSGWVSTSWTKSSSFHASSFRVHAPSAGLASHSMRVVNCYGPLPAVLLLQHRALANQRAACKQSRVRSPWKANGKRRISVKAQGGGIEGGSGVGGEVLGEACNSSSSSSSSRSRSSINSGATDPVSRSGTGSTVSSSNLSTNPSTNPSHISSLHTHAQSLTASITLLLRALPFTLPHILASTVPGLQSSLHLLPPFPPSSHNSRSPFTTNAFRGGSSGGSNSNSHSDNFFGPPSSGPAWPWAPGGRRAHRKLTDLLLAVNAVAFLLQILSNNRLLLLGAKVNSLIIRRGEYYRLLSSAFLHADFQHLVVNSMSLNAIGPDAESLLGGRRMAGIYVASALASSAMSLAFNASPSVGASGAIFGLVGALGVFFLRHKKQLSMRGSAYLRSLGGTVAINMVLGVLWSNIDNWGHLGGLLGGAVSAWLVGPRIISAGFPPRLFDYPPIAELMNLPAKPV